MAFISTFTANDRIDMSNQLLVQFNRALVATSTSFSWFTDLDGTNPPIADVDINGSGFTYSGVGDGQQLATGTITNVSIDVNNNSPLAFPDSESSGDLVISGFAFPPVVTKIDKDRPTTFWNELLSGHDLFDLSGLNAAVVGAGPNVIFGDDLISATSLVANPSDSGGNDAMMGADNEFDLIGDVFTVAGSVGSPIPIPFSAIYDAGDDSITSAATAFQARLIGDAFRILSLGTLHGGNDHLDNSRNRSGTSYVAGDVYDQLAGTVFGGDDNIILGLVSAGSGDVNFFSGGSVAGGDDVISSQSFGTIAGDVDQILSSTTAGTIIGGNDEIHGGWGSHVIAGDVRVRDSTSNTIIAGNDLIFGGTGNDFLFGEVANGSLVGVSGGDDHIFGGRGNDTIQGQTGNDFIDGGDGNDVMDGGDGEDTVSYRTASGPLVVNLGTTVAQNTGGGGSDTLSGLENLEGSRFNDILTDDTGNNTIDGGGGDDVIRAGFGGDVLIGGAGTDTLDYGGAIDAVNVNLDLGTASGNDIGADQVVLFENVTGGLGNDTLGGNSGANILQGGFGDDAMAGGTGNDLYFVDSAADQVTELAGQGSDTVRSTVDYALSATASVELLATTDFLGTIDIDLTGSNIGQNIAGNNGVNELDGGGANDFLNAWGGNDTLDGGTGDDIMQGGLGNDLYFVDSAADQVIETAGQGSDTVRATTHFALSSTASVELLATTNFLGTAAINLTGNNIGQNLAGNNGINGLNGGGGNDFLNAWGGNDTLNGGLGNDTLNGGAGLDAFLFNTALDPTTNVDTIQAFLDTEDTIQLSKSVFTALTGAPDTVLTAGQFALAASPVQADDRIIYDPGTGVLSYDADGGVRSNGVAFATIANPGTAGLGFDDFLIVA